MKVGVIGVGHMGSTIAKVLSESNLDVMVCDHNQEKVGSLVDRKSVV